VSEDQHAKLKQVENRKRIEQAYDNYKRDPFTYETAFITEVLEFAKRKFRRIEIENPQTATIQDADDYAQRVAIDVLNGLANFRGDNFHAWLSKIVHNTKNDFISEMDEQRKTKVGISVVVNNDDGDKEEIDNPLLYSTSGYDHLLNIPKSVTGIDRNICNLLLTQVRGKDGNHRGLNYAEVAHVLNMNEDAVKTRILKLRRRLKAEKNEERARNLNAPKEAARRHRERANADLARIRADKAAKANQ
jgi:RNA polymerase sigma factor (sigma-70 family)